VSFSLQLGAKEESQGLHCPALGGSQDTLEEGGGEEEREGKTEGGGDPEERKGKS